MIICRNEGYLFAAGKGQTTHTVSGTELKSVQRIRYQPLLSNPGPRNLGGGKCVKADV